ncbi:MAG: threonine synthase [Chloroflexi bacterium RBG_16_47_49]|nr:MAG: threonine synthase [Chloroflexi bacterium RBG_16_47_49]
MELSCSRCDKSFSTHQIQTYCSDCNAPLLAKYDLESLRKIIDREKINHRPKGMWRWSELLPVFDDDNIVSLGEGDTPLLQLRHIGRDLGLSKLYLKEEGQNPTGSFKARGLSAAVSKAKELGVEKIVIPSAGNAGGALAAYSARAGIKSLIFMPKSSPPANITESMITGASVELVEGSINDAGKYALEASKTHGWFNMSTFKEPYRVEGKKILGYEIAESLAWKLPDVILYPTGGGTGLVGMWKAFLELDALGWLDSEIKPKMIAVQADGCAPVVKAFRDGKPFCDFWGNAHTIATGLCVPLSFADQLILKYIRASHGTAISVSDDEIKEARRQLAQKEGIYSCPEGAATLAGLSKLSKQGMFQREDTIILFNTGSGLKYISA